MYGMQCNPATSNGVRQIHLSVAKIGKAKEKSISANTNTNLMKRMRSIETIDLDEIKMETQ